MSDDGDNTSLVCKPLRTDGQNYYQSLSTVGIIILNESLHRSLHPSIQGGSLVQICEQASAHHGWTKICEFISTRTSFIILFSLHIHPSREK